MKILLVEDNPDHSELIQECCHQAFPDDCEITVYTTLATGLSEVNIGNYDIALFDLSLPDASVSATTNALSVLKTPMPIIVLTSLNDEDVGRELIKNGAQDFLPKDNLHSALLQRMVNYAIERKHYQVQLENHATNQETFCRSLSHDFKTPIRNIGQLTSMLKEQLLARNALDVEDHNLLEKIDGRLEKMNRLVDGLYHYILTDQRQVNDQWVDLNTLMDELSSLVISDSPKAVTLKYADLPSIKGDPSQLFLLMQNIIENAIKYCSTDPVICISSENISEDQNEGYLAGNKIKICDNGIGIEQQYIQEIFEPFRRLHPEFEHQGTGLGLSVVKRIVSNHNGEIRVSSSLGKGTCFTLVFPRDDSG